MDSDGRPSAELWDDPRLSQSEALGGGDFQSI